MNLFFKKIKILWIWNWWKTSYRSNLNQYKRKHFKTY